MFGETLCKRSLRWCASDAFCFIVLLQNEYKVHLLYQFIVNARSSFCVINKVNPILLSKTTDENNNNHDVPLACITSVKEAKTYCIDLLLGVIYVTIKLVLGRVYKYQYMR